MTLWALSAAMLGWLYAFFACFWYHLFQRHVRTFEKEKGGYRLGLWQVFWRLPPRVALGFSLLSCIPIVAVIWLEGWLLAAVLSLMTGLNVVMWFFAPPGMVIGYKNIAPADSAPMLAGQGNKGLVGSILKLVVFGLIPALGIGALANWLLTRCLV